MTMWKMGCTCVNPTHQKKVRIVGPILAPHSRARPN
jgi:hypothetical protein